MGFQFDINRFKARLRQADRTQQWVALTIGLPHNTGETQLSRWIRNTRRAPDTMIRAIAVALECEPTDFGTYMDGDAKLHYSLNEIYDFYQRTTPQHVVSIASADGFKEVDDADLFARMQELAEAGVELRYYYPHGGGRSLADFASLASRFKPGQVRGYQSFRGARHIFGWQSRFIAITVRDPVSGKHAVEHVFQYVVAGLTEAPGNANEATADVWIRLGDGAGEAYFAELVSSSEPVDSLGIHVNRIQSGVQSQYRFQMSTASHRESYAKLREAIRTWATVEEALTLYVPQWWNAVAHLRPHCVRILDIGCGDGALTAKAARTIASLCGPSDRQFTGQLLITAVESAYMPPGAMDIALHSDAAVVHAMAFEDFPPDDREYDIVLAVHSLYLVDPSYLRKVYELLSPSGIAILVLAPFYENVLNSICGIVDEFMRLEDEQLSLVRPYPEKIVSQDPLRVYAEDLEQAAVHYFGRGSVDVVKVRRMLPASAFVDADGMPTPNAWSAFRYFSNDRWPVDNIHAAQHRLTTLCQGLASSPDFEHCEWALVISKSKTRAMRDLLLNRR